MNLTLIQSIEQAIEFVHFGSNQIQEYIDDEEFDDEDISEMIYEGSAAFFAEGIIFRCISEVAKSWGVDGLTEDYYDNCWDYLFDECRELDGRDLWDGNIKNSWLSQRSVYKEPIMFVFHLIRIGITTYLKDEEIMDYDDVDNWYEKQEPPLLEKCIQLLKDKPRG